jgi:biopolymer transport protein ExbB
MIEYLMAGGGLMIPIVLCSIVAAGITLERLWSLRSQEVNPQSRLAAIHRRIDLGDVTDEWLDELLERSPLERLSAQVLQVRHGGKSVMQDLLFVEVKQIAHELERYLSTLGSMAAITPLLGLLGTVIGMIKVFSAIQAAGLGEASLLAGGISEALVTTAAGLGVAIPALVMHRFLSRRVDELLIDIEHHVSGLIDHCAAQSVHPK